jgi:beta-lactamase class A
MRARRIFAPVLLGALLLPAIVGGGRADDGAGGHRSAGQGVDDLRACSDVSLERRLREVVAAQRLETAVNTGRLALALVDLSAPGHPHLAMLNGDTMIYAASLPKIAILLGAFVEAERGRLPLDERHLQAITAMVRYSSNVDARRVLDWVGERRLIDILLSPRYAFYDPNGKGGLWVGKGYGPSPAFLRDPVAQLSHGATAYQVARFYCLLDAGALVSPELTTIMKEALSRPGIHHKFVKGLERVAGLTLYRKSGTWKEFHSDSVLVEAGAHKYVMVGLARDPSGEDWLERLAEPLHEIVAGSPLVARR